MKFEDFWRENEWLFKAFCSKAWRESAEVERESCAKVCEEPYMMPDGFGVTKADMDCAAAIRARGLE